MNRLKDCFGRALNYMIATLIGLLGFSACSENEEEPPCMYGSPTADYIIKGDITDESGNPIQGVQVSVYQGEYEYMYENKNPQPLTGSTNSTGGFKFDTLKRWGSYTILITRDTDGAANCGEFINDTIKNNRYELTQLKEGEVWYRGLYEIKTNIKLKKKQ